MYAEGNVGKCSKYVCRLKVMKVNAKSIYVGRLKVIAGSIYVG